MPLTLVTGPANSAKAGWVLEAYREALDRAGSARLPAPEPLLVVPTAADVEPYQRELAATGHVFGGEVATFSGLVRAIAQRTGYSARPLGPVARERIVRSVVAAADLEVLATSAATPGFPIALARFFSELQRGLVGPGRLSSALRTWAVESGRGRFAEELAGLYSAYRARLEKMGRADTEGFAWGALDALRADPQSWGRRPALLYGFDDLTPLQLDAVEILSRVAGAPVTVSLPYEAGRVAFAGRAAAVEALRPLTADGGRLVELGDRSEHYAPAARPALHHLERRLFEGAAEPVPPNGAVRLLEAGGERAEAELVGAALLELLRQGVAPSDIAVLAPHDEQPLLHAVLESYGIPVERVARTPLPRLRLGAGLLAYTRAAMPGGSSSDLLMWLRTPGRLARPEQADELESRLRRGRVQTVEAARELLDPSLRGALDALRAAAGQGLEPFLDVLEAELDAIWMAPHLRKAALLGPEGEEDARVAAEVRSAFGELRALAREAPQLAGGPADAVDSLTSLEIRARSGAAQGVLLADPLSVRARRFRAVALCALQDGTFPRRPAPEPFLDDSERRDLARATGLALPLHEDALSAERYLFYATVSRAEEVLFLSFRSSDEEGEPQVASPFLDDVRALFGDELWDRRGRRLLAEVTWPPAQAPTALELRRAQAAATPCAEPGPLAPPAAPAVLAALAERDCEPARALETFAGCGIRWMVESLLRPRRLEPDPEPMTRGSLAHSVLERTLRGLRERTGSARLCPERRDEALAELRAALDELDRRRPGVHGRAERRALESDLRRWLDAECEADSGLEPELLEWSFGGEGDERPALDIGEGVRVAGRVDRIDVGPGGVAMVRDYKGRTTTAAARWAEERRLQAALYAIAARDLLGLDPAGAVYQPIGAADLRARGAVRAGAPAADAFVGTDVLAPEAFDQLLDEMRDLAVAAARDIRAGRIAPCPERCSPRGCAYPGICRAGEPKPEDDA